MAEYKTPGVYIEEIPHLPPSIASVETAIPAFIGFTQFMPSEKEPGAKINKPMLISSIFEYELYYGTGFLETDMSISIDLTQPNNPVTVVTKPTNKAKFMMYYALQMFFTNGGGQCYIVSVGDYNSTGGVILEQNLSDGLEEAGKVHDVTLLVFPDAENMSMLDYYKIHAAAIQQCVSLQNRFTVMDVWIDDTNPLADNVGALRNAPLFEDPEDLKYAAVYYPRIYASIPFTIDETATNLVVKNPSGKPYSGKMNAAKSGFNTYYYMAQAAVADFSMLMPASSAILGIYANTDSSRGVWKAPANVEIINAVKPEITITNLQQESLNVDADAGKSINVIRSFPGRGPAIVWGARTLLGNSNEWRYVPVRRFFIMVEQSIKNAVEQFVFEPNDENTWVRVKAMIQNYLIQQWKDGALMGSTAQEAFFIHIGLGQTMSEVDVWEGRMIVLVGIAAVRPAEFIILRFMHKMLEES